MSYLLDALRKSEAERDRTATPDLNTRHRPAVPARRSSHLPLLLAIALVANAAVLAAWLILRTPEVPPPAADTKPPGPGAGTTGGSDAAARDPAPTPPGGGTRPDPTAAGPERADPGGTGPPRAPAAEPAVVAIRDLPADVQDRIPPLAFSTHIYAEEARYREVGINGRRYAEGATVQGMRLVEITESGVVLELDGRRFAVSVLEDWDY